MFNDQRVSVINYRVAFSLEPNICRGVDCGLEIYYNILIQYLKLPIKLYIICYSKALIVAHLK